jgi:flagellar motor component MotA
MDLGTTVGLTLAFALIIGAMITGAGVAPFVDVPSALIVISGTFAATVVLPKTRARDRGDLATHVSDVRQVESDR